MSKLHDSMTQTWFTGGTEEQNAGLLDNICSGYQQNQHALSKARSCPACAWNASPFKPTMLENTYCKSILSDDGQSYSENLSGVSGVAEVAEAC
jgi:hypothetical protein